MERIGVIKPEVTAAQDMLEYAKLAEKNEFESVWLSEDYCFTDAIGPSAAIAAVTRKIGIGIGAINIYTRSLPLIAMTATTLDGIANGRALLGIGSGVKGWIEQQGLKYHSKSLLALRQSVELLKRLMAGEKVSQSCEFFTVRDIQLALRPLRQSIPIYIAAMGPRMLQLCGEIADGVLLSTCTPLQYMNVVRQNLELGAEVSGRSCKEIDIAGYIIFSVSEEPSAARESVKSILARELALEEFNPLIQMSNIDLELVAPIRNAIREGNFGKATENVNDEIIDLFAIAGTPDVCRAKLQRYRQAGLRLPIIYPVGNIEADIRTAALCASNLD